MTGFKMIDTKDLQIKSLVEFAQVLGYVPVNNTRLCQGFVVHDKKFYVANYLSLDNMLQLHNFDGEVSDVVVPKNVLVVEDLFTSAKNAKLVEQVKLQRDKSQLDGVKCQNHMVKLTEKGKELYEHLRSL